jgi:hypothetical protein
MKNSFFRSLIIAISFAAAAALVTSSAVAEDNESAPRPLLYQAVDTTDGSDNGSGDSNGGGVIYPGTGH